MYREIPVESKETVELISSNDCVTNNVKVEEDGGAQNNINDDGFNMQQSATTSDGLPVCDNGDDYKKESSKSTGIELNQDLVVGIIRLKLPLESHTTQLPNLETTSERKLSKRNKEEDSGHALKLTSPTVSIKKENNDKELNTATPPKQSENESKFTEAESIETAGAENIGLDVHTKSHFTQSLNLLSVSDGEQSQRNVENDTEGHPTLSTPSSAERNDTHKAGNCVSSKHRVGSKSNISSGKNETDGHNKSYSRHSDHHNESHHGSVDKAKNRDNKRKSDESLYDDMKRKRNKLYDEKKIAVKENETLRQKVDATEKKLATVIEEMTKLQQAIFIRDESLKEVNSHKFSLEEELKVVRSREDFLQMQVQVYEAEQFQLRAQLEAQVVATSTVNNLLQQQMDNAKRFLKCSAKASTLVQAPTDNVAVNKDCKYFTHITTYIYFSVLPRVPRIVWGTLYRTTFPFKTL